MNAVSAVLGMGEDEEEFFTIADLFQSQVLHYSFRKFLSRNCQSISSLCLDVDHGSRMDIVIRTPSGQHRRLGLEVAGVADAREIRSATEIKLPDSISVMQIVLMFSCQSDYPYYTLELKDESHLYLCCRKQADNFSSPEAFEDLLTRMAAAADRLEDSSFFRIAPL